MLQIITINSLSTGKFTTEVINNRPHLVTQMVTIVSNSVMNGLFYPAIEIENSYKQLDGLPAPAGHPVVAGVRVSASHPLAVNQNHIGAFIRSPCMVGNQAINDLCFDIGVAEKDPRGVDAMERIKNRQQIGVSTGLNADVDKTPGSINNTKFNGSVHNINFDHAAILLDETPAGDQTFTINSDQDHIMICNVSDAISIGEPPAKKEGKTVDFKDILMLAIIGNSANSLNLGDKARLEGMSEEALVTAIQNSVTPPAVTMDQAHAVVKEAGLFVNNISAEAGAEYIDNAEGYKAYKAEQDKVRGELVDKVVTNSEMTKEQVEAMPQDTIVAIANSLSIKRADYSLQNQSVNNNDRGESKSNVDYSDTPH